LRVESGSRLALRPTIPARERFYADTRLARRGNAPSRQTGSTAGLVLLAGVRQETQLTTSPRRHERALLYSALDRRVFARVDSTG
jgi:hypothetical protein